MTKKESNFKSEYKKTIAPALMSKYKYKSVMQIPKLEKITINMGVGRGIDNKSNVTDAAKELALISGQKPLEVLAKKSLASFKLREGMPTGNKVTLRGESMYSFLEKLIKISLPRTRDFRGLSPKSFDGRGNYNLGIKEYIIFPEIDYDKVKLMKGCDINIVTSATTDEEAYGLIKGFGMPFKDGGVK